jgi:hypothetical protein
MEPFSRRLFLIRSSIAAGAAGLASSVPGLIGVITDDAAPAADGAAAETDGALAQDAGTAGPLVAHVRNAATGEVGILNGTQEVVVHDPQLVTRILGAGR